MMMDKKKYERYHRQMILKDFGIANQDKLFQAKILVIGAGGLGCPVLQYLAAAGIGYIGVVDDGVVELSNLHRQVLYTMNDLYRLKVDCVKSMLEKMNPDTAVLAFPDRLDTSNALELIGEYDIIIDGTDNFQSKYMINDACVLLNKPLIYGALSRYEGQVAIFRDQINYRDVFPNPPQEGEIMNCSEAGVLGVLPGIIGNMMASECIKLLTGIGEPLTGQLLTYNALNNMLFTVVINATAQSAELIPKTKEEFINTDYYYLCNHAEDAAELIPNQLLALLSKEDVDIVDVREWTEKPDLIGLDHLRIPLSVFENDIHRIKKHTVVFVCQSGKRSRLAAHKFGELNKETERKIYSLKGGIHSLMDIV